MQKENNVRIMHEPIDEGIINGEQKDIIIEGIYHKTFI
jgi:hypothetical protein